MGLFAIRILSVFALLLNGIFPPFQMVSATPRAQGTVIETVRKGDTLQKVALRYRTDWKHLKRINGLTRNGLVPGQSLLVPGTRLKIRNGDSAWDISLRHGLNLRQLKKANPGKRLSSLRPGTWLNIPQPRKRNISTGQFFVPTGVPEKDRQLLRRYRQVSRVGLFHIPIRPNGTLGVRSFGTATSQIRRQGQFAYPVVTNLTDQGFDDKLARKVLSRPTARKTLVDSIWHLLKANRFQGVMLDIEGLKPRDRKIFNRFLRELSHKLHASGMEVTISVPPKQSPGAPAHSGAYDYPWIGRFADRIFVMAYDWYIPPYTRSGPSAPYAEVKATMKYASSVIPRHKLYLGIPLYAYEWVTGTNQGTAYSQSKAIEKAVDHGSVIHFDVQSRNSWFRYREKGKTRTVWFEDARSLTNKFQLVRNMGWAGMGGWQMGLLFPQGEALLEKQFRMVR